MPDDDDLIASFLARRDEPSFLALYRRHTPVIYRVVWRHLGGRADDAADVVQETWVRAIGGLAGFRGESTLRTWLCGIALNLARVQRRGADRDAPGPPRAAGIALPRDTDRIDLERAIAALPDGYRDIVVLHDIEGFTHAEIAHMLGIEEGTSRSQLHHARRSLRAHLKSSGAAS